MCSHRSGESGPTIADLAVGLCTGEIKTGAPVEVGAAKYNRKFRIERTDALRISEWIQAELDGIISFDLS